MSSGRDTLYNEVARHEASSGGIRDFDELRNRAVFQCFRALWRDEREKDAPRGEVFPLAEWAPFLRGEVKDAAEAPAPGKDLADRECLLLETSLRILGEAGDEEAGPAIRALQEKLGAPGRGKEYRIQSVLGEAGWALTKIRFLNRWDAAGAMEVIHGNPRALHAQNDLADWLRKRYSLVDPDGYHRRLLEDLAGRTGDAALLRETLRELGDRYGGEPRDAVAALLGHAVPEVAAHAARVILKSQPEDGDALAALDRIASDPAAPVPPFADWFGHFARVTALEHLVSKDVPAASRWDAARVRRQLGGAQEDGRMVRRLISALEILKDPLTGAEEVAAWRRVLAGRLNRGMLTAVEELCKAKDRGSVSAMRGVLEELKKGCRPVFFGDYTPEVPYPWTCKDEIEGLEKKLKELEGP